MTAHIPLPHRNCRLRPSGRAQMRGYIRLLVESPESTKRKCFIPVSGETSIIACRFGPGSVISIGEGDAAIEPLDWSASAICWLRRRFTSIGRAVLNFGFVEIFAEGCKSRTRDYRKLVKSARAARMPFDGPFLQAHPELILGWSPEAAVPAEPAGPNQLSVAIMIHRSIFIMSSSGRKSRRCSDAGAPPSSCF